MEIHKLHKMLLDAGIEHEWLERGVRFGRNRMADVDWGYQLIVYYPDGERMVSAIEGFGTYGYMDWDGTLIDLIEIMGLLTPEEEQHDCVVGYLTAEEVFRRIKEAVDET